MATCKRCGHEAGESKFCPECGNDLRENGQSVSEQASDELNVSDSVPSDDTSNHSNHCPETFQDFQPASYNNEASKKEQKKSRTKVIVGIVAILAVIGIIGGIGGNTNSTPSTDNDASESTQQQESDSSQSNQDSSGAEEEKQKAEQSKAEAKSELEGVIANAMKTNSADYTPESYATLAGSIEAGNIVLANESSTENDYDTAKSNIINAQTSLKEAFNPDKYSWPSYTDVARNPDSYKGQLMAFTGKVIQVIEGTTETNLRVATDGSYGDVVFVGYDPEIMGGTRVLEDDTVTVYGTCVGLYTYESTLGASVSVPGLYADSVVIG